MCWNGNDTASTLFVVTFRMSTDLFFRSGYQTKHRHTGEQRGPSRLSNSMTQVIVIPIDTLMAELALLPVSFFAVAMFPKGNYTFHAYPVNAHKR